MNILSTKRALVGAAIFAAPFLVQPAPALAYTSSWEGCLECQQQLKIKYDPKTQDAFGKVSKEDKNIYIVTVYAKGDKTKERIHEYWMRGTCDKNVFRLTTNKKAGLLDIHNGSRGKKA